MADEKEAYWAMPDIWMRDEISGRLDGMIGWLDGTTNKLDGITGEWIRNSD